MHFTPTFFQAFCLMAAIMAAVVAPAKTISLPETPPVVQSTIHARLGDARLDEIDQTNEDGETTFDVSYTTKTGDEKGFTVADDGTVLSVEVALTDAPAGVQKTIHDQAPGWELKDLSKNMADTEVSYEVEVSKQGKEKNFTVASDGELLSAEVTPAETPPAVQATIKNQVADGTLQTVSEEFDPAGNSFEVEAMAKDGVRNAFSVRADGALLSVEVSLEKIPAAARQTIRARIGDGKILRIDKALVEKKDGVLPYEVEGRKGGKPFNFSVGPRGRFLGLDD